MGRKHIDCKVRRPKEKIKSTFNKRKEGLKNKAQELGILCGCEVALIVFPPNEHINQDVIDLSVNGTIDEIYRRYFMFQQQNPGRQQLLHIPPSPAIPQDHQPVQANSERGGFALPTSAGSQNQQPLQEGLQGDGYGPLVSHGRSRGYMNPNTLPSAQQQVEVACTHHNMQGMQQGHLRLGMQHPGNLRPGMQHPGNPGPGMQHRSNLSQGTGQHGNLPQYIQNNMNLNPRHQNNHVPLEQGNYVPLEQGNQVPPEQGNHVPPQQGYDTNYVPGQMSHELGVNPVQQTNELSMNMPELLQDQMQAAAPQSAPDERITLSPEIYMQYFDFPPLEVSPDSHGTIENE